MGDPQPQLRLLRRQIQTSATAGAAGGLPLGLLSLLLGSGLEHRELERMFALAVVITTVSLVGFVHRARRWLLPFKALEGGANDRRTISAAARAIAELPGRARQAVWVHLGFGFSVTAATWVAFVPGMGLSFLLRTAVTGVSAMAISAFFASFLAQRASRKALEALIVVGLALEDAVVLATAEQRRFRSFLMELVGIFAVASSLLVAQATLVRASTGQSGAGFDWVPLALVAVAGVFACTGASAAAKGLSVPMRQISARAQRIREGHLDPPSLLASEGEVWSMSVAFTRLEGQLGGAVAQLTVASDQLSSTTEGLIGTLGGQEQGAAEQASALDETSATTEELARSAGQIADNATEVARVAERTLGAAQTGQRSADAFFAAMVGMRTQNQAVADAVIRLNKRVQQIGKVVEFINEVADKSDLLALNAELEGTKAGEVGRGFSLVAAEMRRLAEDVLRSTGQIERAITDIRDATNAAVMATEAGVKATESGTGAANEVSQRLRVILEHARETSESVRSISLATQQQQTGTHQLADAMAEILRVTREGAVATQQMHGANVDLSTLAKSLRETVRRFELKGVEAPS